MKLTTLKGFAGAVAFLICLPWTAVQAQQDPLSSWNDGASKQAIVEFVGEVTREAGPDFVQPAERVATFDNDGTLWAEQPLYFQLVLRSIA